MSAAWITIAGLTVATAAIKAAGPVALGGRELPGPLALVVGGLAPAVLASLVVFGVFSDSPTGLTVDARLAGVGAAAISLALRAPLLVVLLAAAGTAAGLRALGVG